MMQGTIREQALRILRNHIRQLRPRTRDLLVSMLSFLITGAVLVMGTDSAEAASAASDHSGHSACISTFSKADTDWPMPDGQNWVDCGLAAFGRLIA